MTDKMTEQEKQSNLELLINMKRLKELCESDLQYYANNRNSYDEQYLDVVDDMAKDIKAILKTSVEGIESLENYLKECGK